MTAPIVRLYVEALVAGSGAGTALVLVHGFTGDSTTWARLVPWLGVERRVLGVDLVGHGRSDAPAAPEAYTMGAAVASARAAVREAGAERAHWLGYSMGGRVALSLALEAPEAVASLTLVGASPGIADPAAREARRKDDEALADLIERQGLEAFVDRWMSNPLFDGQARLGPAYLAAARAQRLAGRPRALARTLAGMGTGAMAPLGARLGEVHAPVLVVAGEDDPKFRTLAGEMAARLPRATVAVVPESGHGVHVEAPEALGALVRAFLRRVEAM